MRRQGYIPLKPIINHYIDGQAGRTKGRIVPPATLILVQASHVQSMSDTTNNRMKY